MGEGVVLGLLTPLLLRGTNSPTYSPIHPTDGLPPRLPTHWPPDCRRGNNLQPNQHNLFPRTRFSSHQDKKYTSTYFFSNIVINIRNRGNVVQGPRGWCWGAGGEGGGSRRVSFRRRKKYSGSQLKYFINHGGWWSRNRSPRLL